MKNDKLKLKNQIISLEEKYHMQIYSRLPVVMVKGNGQYLYDDKGQKYLDFLSGLGVTSLGHCHPTVVQAAQEQLGQLVHTSNLFYTQPLAKLAKKIVDLSVGEGQVFFANSGAEANEAAIKLVRRWAKSKGKVEPEIITAQNSFHGRTLKTLAATAQPEKQKPFEPLPPGFKHVAFNDFAALEKAIDNKTAAIMLEVIQGEGGVYHADKDYLQKVAKLCHEENILFILDEVQTGLCRTGKFFAYQHYGIEPDILTLAKALGNGLPIGACVAKAEIAAAFQKGDHGSTFGGGPVVCAAALAVLDVMEKEDLAKKADDTGRYLTSLIKEQLAEHITEIRGMGLMIGIELKKPIAKEVALGALGKRLIVNAIGDKTVRLLPPLIISKEDCNYAIGILKDILVSSPPWGED